MPTWFTHNPSLHRPDVQLPRFSELGLLSSWVQNQEANVSDLRPNCGATIQWARRPQKTPNAVIFVHGFSASPTECNPFPQELAHALNANLYSARLRGHGRTGPAMCEGTFQDWLDDAATALHIGRQLGEHIVAVGCSTGAALLVLLAARYQMQPDALCLISPSFANANHTSRLLELRGRRILLRLTMGRTRQWQSDNPEVSRIWTNCYPSSAILPYIDAMRVLRQTPLHTISCPTIAFAAPKDQLVSFEATQRRLSEFKGPTQLTPIYDSEEPLQHNIIGNVLSPSTLENCLEETIVFLKKRSTVTA